MKISFKTSRASFDGILEDNPIAEALIQRLPFASTLQRWGDEIYFDIPVAAPNFLPTRQVAVGDIAYWPDGPCLCIFFGQTPASLAREPRPASDVTVLGHTDAPPDLLRLIEGGQIIEVEKAERNQGPGTRRRNRPAGR